MKDIQSHQLENKILDNTVGVETTFHHGFNVIVIHVGVSSASATHIKSRNAVSINKIFFMRL